MKLLHLMRDIGIEKKTKRNFNDIEVHGIADISNNVKSGFLFVAIPGSRMNGHDFIEQAVNQGAHVIVGEEDRHDLSVPYIKVKDSRKALGRLAKIYYGDPSNQKVMIGITGTNGKTTISHLIKHILEANGISCSVIGTIHNIINGKVIETLNTTPNSLVLNELLVSSNDQVVIMETSSHGLAQHRLEGIQFDFCLFSNLSHDHLDYHESMEEYYESKKKLFEKIKPKGKVIVNIDDSWGEKLMSSLKVKEVDIYAIGQSLNSNLRISELSSGERTSMRVQEGLESYMLYSPIPGRHNLYNSAMAYSVAKQLEINTKQALLAIQRFPGVKGRFEVLNQRRGPTIVIDYAHTADALFNCLMTVKELGANKIVHVFGFRGDRDETKRVEMIKISSELSDQYILTIDDLNSRSQKEMIGIYESINTKYGNYKGMIIADRTMAIKQAIACCNSNDWVVITGKGHEKYQQKFCLPTSSDRKTVNYINDERKKLSH